MITGLLATVNEKPSAGVCFNRAEYKNLDSNRKGMKRLSAPEKIPDEIKKAKTETETSDSKNYKTIKDMITELLWPWAPINEIDKPEKLEILLGSSTPDISNDDASGSCFDPKSDDADTSDWDDIKQDVSKQIAEE